jgi:Asp-tRNA(Asn)/Glu-tRNA(Gln) amidotransferase C subunit
MKIVKKKLKSSKMELVIAKSNYEIKDYVDSKWLEKKGEIIAYIKYLEKKDKEWKEELLNVLRKRKVIREEDAESLTCHSRESGNPE